MKIGFFESAPWAHMTADVMAPGRMETGGQLVVNGAGDVIEYLPAPPHTDRSATHISFDGKDFEAAFKRVKQARADALWGGITHRHPASCPDPSAQDQEQLDEWHRTVAVPPLGLLFMVTTRTERGMTWKAFRSPAAKILEPIELWVVPDVRAARERLEGKGPIVPAVRRHGLGTTPGARRLAEELQALEADAYVVDARVVKAAVKVSIEHEALWGTLHATLPPEGWERFPKLEIERAPDARTVLVADTLARLAAQWSSAWTLADLVAYLRSTGVWPKKGPLAALRARRAS